MSKRPNILLITADQMRRDSLGAYGNREVKTSHIDTLANEGIVFDNHFVQNPGCMPSRWSIITGQYPRNHGVRENGVMHKKDETTLIRVLRDNDYYTGAFGKMHLTPQMMVKEGEDENWPDDDFGFQEKYLTNDSKRGEYLDFLESKHKKFYQIVLQQGEEKNRQDLIGASERTFDLGPQIKKNEIPAELHQSSWIADKVMSVLDRKKEKPFFIWCSFVDPHHPFDPPEPYASLYDPNALTLPVSRKHEMDDKPRHFFEMYTGVSPGNEKYELFRITDLGWKTIKAKYYGMVSLIDYNVGRILERLKENGLFEDTLIVFTSDHGELLGDHGLLFKGPFHYDGLIRVPLIMKWGSKICGGTRVNEITQHIDLLPTLLSYSGIPISRGVQGRLIQPLIGGDRGNGYDYALVEHNCHDWGFNVKTLRSKDWRFTYYAGLSFGELYDLNKDPHELYNVWGLDDYRSVVETLKTVLLNRLIDTEDYSLERQSKF